MSSGIGAIVSLFGMLLSALGMGTLTYTQINQTRAAQGPQAQVQPYAQCPSGQGQLRQAQDGSYYIQCLEMRP